MGGFSCWFSFFLPHLVQVHPHSMAKKIFQKWEHNCCHPPCLNVLIGLWSRARLVGSVLGAPPAPRPPHSPRAQTLFSDLSSSGPRTFYTLPLPRIPAPPPPLSILPEPPEQFIHVFCCVPLCDLSLP